MSELLPCPHCYGAAIVFSSDGLYGVNCADEDCACGTPMMPTLELAAATWNRRAPTSASHRSDAIPPDVRERLAAYAHEAWSGWMRYMFSKGMDTMDVNYNGVSITYWTMEPELYDRWQRQMNTPYADLPESEKASDRDEADKMLAIVRTWLDAQDGTP